MYYFGIENTHSIPTKNTYQKSAPMQDKEAYLADTTFVLQHVQPFAEHREVTSIQLSGNGEDDGVFNYASNIIELGLMACNFDDASHEGDGERLLCCWKFFLLHFRQDGRHKYALEVFSLLSKT